MPIPHTCLSCSKTFSTINGLQNHANAKNHIANPFFCTDCDISFASSGALDSHCNSPRHVDEYSSDESECYESSDVASSNGDSDSDIEPFCEPCNRWFNDTFALNQHLAYSQKHNWCFDCSRDFSASEDLTRHQNSLAHQERVFQCPFCSSMFKSPSGIALHIESGCHRITRHQVTAAAHAMRIVPNISLKTITGSTRRASAPMTVNTFIATEDSFNGTAYECYLCDRTFRTLQGLNAHLNSPAHDDEEFKCPKCKTEFKLISGFAQHLESEACGLAKRNNVNQFFDDMTAQFSRLLTH